MMRRFINIFAFGLIAFSTAAHAADPFTVAGVPVDATGESAIEAQTIAISEGQVAAARIILDRLTLGSERASKGLPEITNENVAKLIRALDISNEKRSANRYLGNIKVAFNPSQVQSFLRQNGFTMVSTQTRERVVIPILSGEALWSDNDWEKVWQSGDQAYSLTPVRAISGGSTSLTASQARSGDLNALQSIGQRYGVQQILVAEASQSILGVTVSLTDISLDTGERQNLGTVTGQDYQQASLAAIALLEDQWKAASVSLAENAEIMTVSVLYRTHRDWQSLQDAINGSAQIQGARLDALSKDGALMTVTYGGNFDRLRNELSYKGVTIERHPTLGVVLSRTGQF